MTTQDLATWQEQVEKELRGKPLEALYWTSPEGIEIKPLYTAADLEVTEQTGTLPGMAKRSVYRLAWC